MPWRTTVAGVLLLLVFANVMANRVIPSWLYVPFNVTIAVVLILVARRSVTVEDMGFTNWRRGALWGGALFAATAGVMLVGLAIPAFSDLYNDNRVTESTSVWAYHAFVRIPLGTAFMEETAFRAVLPALFAVRWGVLRGCILASVCFGFWHILPSMGLTKANPTMTDLFGDGTAGVVATVALAVVGTTLAGLAWCWIRYRSGSVLSTILGHVATNTVGYTIVFWVNR
jgi:membrane protease YdiL (CAAX protease family)